jgi:hypothetical protein
MSAEQVLAIILESIFDNIFFDFSKHSSFFVKIIVLRRKLQLRQYVGLLSSLYSKVTSILASGRKS